MEKPISGQEIIEILDKIINDMPKQYVDYKIEHDKGIEAIKSKIKEYHISNDKTN